MTEPGGVAEPAEAPRLPVRRIAPDRIALVLDETERRILGQVLRELRDALGDPDAAAAGGPLARLFPPAFPDDAEAEASYRDLVGAELLADRLERVARVEAALEAGELEDAAAAAWLGVLNDARLAVGTSLGVTQEAGPPLPDPDDPDAMRIAVFGWLGWLVEGFVAALEDALPAVPDEAA